MNYIVLEGVSLYLFFAFIIFLILTAIVCLIIAINNDKEKFLMCKLLLYKNDKLKALNRENFILK